MSRKLMIAAVLVLSVAANLTCYLIGTMQPQEPILVEPPELQPNGELVKVFKLPDAPDLRLSFVGMEGIGSDSTDISHVDFEFKGQRVYQYFHDGEIGYILRYTIKSKDPAKPLAYSDRVKRKEDGTLDTYQMHNLIVNVSVNDPKWKFVLMEGRGWECWKPDGSVQCVGGFGHDSVRLLHFSQPNSMISLWSTPEDGFYSTGEPKNATPVHKVDVDFYIHPPKKEEAKDATQD